MFIFFHCLRHLNFPFSSVQGKVDEAEKYFLLASKEAKEGFGERDPHVASSLNNLVAQCYFYSKKFMLFPIFLYCEGS